MDNVKAKETLKELTIIEVNQLHNATLQLSKQSFDIKKICVTVNVSVLSYMVSIKHSFIMCVGVLFCITFFFYLVDVMTYFYQRRLRKAMNDKLDSIKSESGISVNSICNDRFCFLLKAFINASHFIYYLFFSISIFCFCMKLLINHISNI